MPYFKDIDLFLIHIPKNGGTAIREYLRSKNISVDFACAEGQLHAPYFIAKNYLNKKIDFVSIIRNPYDRIVSYFNYHMNPSLSKLSPDYPYFLKIRNELDSFNSIKDKFTNYIKKYCFLKDSIRYSIFQNQIYYLKESQESNLISDNIHIIRYENLEESLGKFNPFIFNEKMPKIKMTDSCFTKKDLYTEESVDMILNVFKKDFEILAYPKEISL
jgi:hypothetical protein